MAPKKKSASLQSTLFEQLKPANENLLLKLPISDAKLDELLKTDDMQTILEYNPEMSEPKPYEPELNELAPIETSPEPVKKSFPKPMTSQLPEGQVEEPKEANEVHNDVCFWCCHSILGRTYGMPIRYDSAGEGGQGAFSVYGSFCSLQCAAAHNFSSNGSGDRAFEVHSWIQMLSKRYGFEGYIRPAPSRYLLKMFGGPLSIEEFRQAHCNSTKTYTLNIPPMISVPSQMETINTSFAMRPIGT